MSDFSFRFSVIVMLVLILAMLLPMTGWMMEIHSRVMVYLPEIFQQVLRK